MYDFIYFIIYQQQIEKGKSLGFARYNGCLIVGLTVIIHLMLLFSILKTIFSDWFTHHLGKVSEGTNLFFTIAIFCLVFYYYNARKTKRVMNKYAGKVKQKKIFNLLKITVIIFIPLMIEIMLARKY